MSVLTEAKPIHSLTLNHLKGEERNKLWGHTIPTCSYVNFDEFFLRTA